MHVVEPHVKMRNSNELVTSFSHVLGRNFGSRANFVMVQQWSVGNKISTHTINETLMCDCWVGHIQILHGTIN